MNELIPIIAIVFGTSLAGFIFYGIYRIIRMWIGTPSGDVVSREEFNRLGRAFVEFRKDSRRRIENLEAIVSEGKTSGGKKKKENRKLGGPTETIEVDTDTGEESEKEKDSSGDSNLRNMLRE